MSDSEEKSESKELATTESTRVAFDDKRKVPLADLEEFLRLVDEELAKPGAFDEQVCRFAGMVAGWRDALDARMHGTSAMEKMQARSNTITRELLQSNIEVDGVSQRALKLLGMVLTGTRPEGGWSEFVASVKAAFPGGFPVAFADGTNGDWGQASTVPFGADKEIHAALTTWLRALLASRKFYGAARYGLPIYAAADWVLMTTAAAIVLARVHAAAKGSTSVGKENLDAALGLIDAFHSARAEPPPFLSRFLDGMDSIDLVRQGLGAKARKVDPGL